MSDFISQLNVEHYREQLNREYHRTYDRRVALGSVPIDVLKQLGRAVGSPWEDKTFTRNWEYAVTCHGYQQPSDIYVAGSPFETKQPETLKPQKKAASMKSQTELRNTAAMLSEDIVTVTATIHEAERPHTFLCPRDLAQHLSAHDLVVAQVRDGHKIVTVDEVHDECLLNDPSNVQYKWILQKVDTNVEHQLNEWLDGAAKALYDLERKAARKKMLEDFGLPDYEPAPLSILNNATDVDDAEVIE